jgi:hypothetical protein
MKGEVVLWALYLGQTDAKSMANLDSQPLSTDTTDP